MQEQKRYHNYAAIVIMNLSKSGIKVFAFENILMNKRMLTFLAHSKRRSLNRFKPSPHRRLASEDMSTLFSESKFTLQNSKVMWERK